MTPFSRVASALRGVPQTENAVCLHTWGTYPFEIQGKLPIYCHCGGDVLADIDEGFWRLFGSDWIQTRQELSHRDIWVTCEAELPHQPPEIAQTSGNTLIPIPETKADIDALFPEPGESMEGELARGSFEHIGVLRTRLDEHIFIAPNQGAPGSSIWGLNFEDSLIFAHEQPALTEYYIHRACQAFLPAVQAAKQCGAHAFIFSEGFGGAIDLLSPEDFTRTYLTPKIAFYQAVKAMGLYAIGYCLGDVRPYLHLLEQIPMDGMMIEESKKRFVLDPVEIRRRLKPEICLFGNLDSILLLNGDHAEIRAEVNRQAAALRDGSFIFINGSPIAPGTPPDNLRVFLDAARGAQPC